MFQVTYFIGKVDELFRRGRPRTGTFGYAVESIAEFDAAEELLGQSRIDGRSL